MEPIIQVSDASFSYPKSPIVFEQVNFDVTAGETIGIVGRSGSGKTTLCYLLRGLIPHTYSGKLRGSIIVDGYDTRKTRFIKLTHSIGMVFQGINNQLFGNSVREEIQFGLKNLHKDLEIAEHVMEQLDILDLAEKSPHNLSMGEKQRVILASIIAIQSKILILDEPCVHLDYQNRIELKECLERLNREYNITLIISSNDPWLIGNLCNNVIHIQNNSVVKKPINSIIEIGETWKWKIDL
jgi:energy-coupling factor transporter ATP-binding protein EcfA2